MSATTRPKNAAPESTDDGLLTRAGVARQLGIGVSSVRRLEGHALHPIVGLDGVHRFDRREVDDHAAKVTGSGGEGRRPPRVRRTPTREKGQEAEGRRHARAFRLFEAGRSHAEVVMEAALPAGVVRQLYAEWRAGYRQPPTVPAPLPEGSDGEARAHDEAAWLDWERQMQALSSALDGQAPLLPPCRPLRPMARLWIPPRRR